MSLQYIRIDSIDQPLFPQMHKLMKTIFPPEEVLAFELWKEPLQDQGLRVYAAVWNGEVVGATEYRYYPEMNVAMTDFTIIGREGLGIGRFLWKHRERDIEQWAASYGKKTLGMFAEIYDPYRVRNYEFGGVKPMDAYVRREVLSHIGYLKLDIDYVHPSWELQGDEVTGLDLGFLPLDEDQGSLTQIPGALIARFLTTYYAIIQHKPESWRRMVDMLEQTEQIGLLPI